MHTCGFCYEACNCDGDDTWLDQPDNCVHLTEPGACPTDDDCYEEDE